MYLTLNPADYGLNNDGRLVIYNVKTKKYLGRRPVKKDEIVDISEKEIADNIIDYKFKFQKKDSNGVWQDIKNYFFLEQARFIKLFWLNQRDFSEDELVNIIKYFSRASTNKNKEIMIDAFQRAVKFIIRTKIENLKNLEQYLEVINKKEIKMPVLWDNINLYLKELIDIKKMFVRNKYIRITYPKLIKIVQETPEIKEYFKNKIKSLRNKDLQFGYALSAIIESFFGNREASTRDFEKCISYDNNYAIDYHIGLGIYTYKDVYEKNHLSNAINFSYQKSFEKRDITFSVSVDPWFLRKYGMQMFYSIIALKKYNFHFHIVAEDDEANSVINDAKELFSRMTEFFQSNDKVKMPSFSSEVLPEKVANNTTYYACARFTSASKIMEKFNSDIITLDADYLITDDLSKMINALIKNDVAVVFASGLNSMFPWTRVMGGALYIKNNEKGKEFLKIISDYIMTYISINNSWTLDQNALNFAYDEVINKNMKIKLGNISEFPRPLMQPAIRRFIEN